MARAAFADIDAYIAAQPAASRPILQQVRRTIARALPGADEVISYQIPAFRLSGRVVIFFAGWKRHYSLYPVTDALTAAFGDELAPYEVSKGTIRFPLEGPAPEGLIERIAAFKLRELSPSREAQRPKR